MNPMDTAWMILKEMNRFPLGEEELQAAREAAGRHVPPYPRLSAREHINTMPPAPLITPNPNEMTPEQKESYAAGGPPPPLDPEFMARIERNRANAQQNDQANSMRNAAKREARKRE